MQRIVIIGGGAAGMAAAYRLHQAGCDVTLIERRDRLGGHCFAVDVPLGGGGSVRVDGGVNELHRPSSPCLSELLDALGVRLLPVADDESVAAADGATVWSSRPQGSMPWLAELRRFEREAPEVLASDFYENWTLQSYLDRRGYSKVFRRSVIYPRSAGRCVPASGDPRGLPIRSLVRCWQSVGLLGSALGDRVAVAGGMHRYAQSFEQWFGQAGGRLLASRRVVGIERGDEVRIRVIERRSRLTLTADEVVFSVAPDRAVALLDEPTVAERLLAANFRSRHIRRIVHQDPHLMPNCRNHWGAYNYRADTGTGSPGTTFYLNRLARLAAGTPDVFVTTDPRGEVDPRWVLDDRRLSFPEAGHSAREARRRVRAIQGRNRTWFCGAYLREPFLHEQAVASGFRLAERMLAERGRRPEIGAVTEPVRAVA